jgi:hypothetical protein
LTSPPALTTAPRRGAARPRPAQALSDESRMLDMIRLHVDHVDDHEA